MKNNINNYHPKYTKYNQNTNHPNNFKLSKEIGKQYFRVTNDFYYDEGWCASETWSWCNWLWWRVVCESDLILMQLTMMKGGVRVRLGLDAINYDEGWCASETWSWCNWLWWNWLWWRVVREWDLILMELIMMKGGIWWGREVVRKGNGEEGRKPEHETLCFSGKVAAGGDERYLVCAAVAAGVVSVANCSSYVFCKKWLFLCA